MPEEITLTSDGSQTFSTVLDGITYDFIINYNTRLNLWTFNLISEGLQLVNGVALLGGVDIVKQYTFSLKNLYSVNIDNPTIDAIESNLGTEVKLYKLTQSEVDTLG